MTSPEVEAERQRLRQLIAAVAAVTVFGFALGEMFPLLSLILERDGVRADIIGYNTAMQPAGILLSGFTVPLLVRWFGSKRVVIGASLAAAAIVMAYPVTPIFWGWFALRFVQGLAVSTLFSISEAWVVQSSEPSYRGRTVAIYSSVLAVSFGLGPTIIAAVGIDGILPFAIGAAVLAAASLPMLSVQRDAVEGGDHSTGFLSFVPKAPVLLLSVGVFAVFDAACLGFLPVYAVKRGLPQDQAALTLSVLTLGNVVLSFPIGWLADRYSKRAVMAGCGIVTAVFTTLLPVSTATPLMWVVLIIIGASSVGIYTVALSEVGDRFSGADLVAATSAMSTMWGLGALLGALMTGWVMAAFGPDAFPYTQTLVFLIFLSLMLVRERWKRSHPQRVG